MKRLKTTTLPPGAIIGLIAVCALVVALGGYMLLVRPEKSRVSSIDKQIAAKQATIAQYKAESSTQHVGAPKIRIADVYRLAQAMPAQLDMPDVLLELDQIARDAGIRITSITPQPPVAAGAYEQVPIALQFDGDYYSVTDLLYRLRTLVSVRHGQLEANGRLYSIQSIALQPDKSELRATVTVDTYVYGAVATGPTIPTPSDTSTDTTATTDSTDTTTDSSTTTSTDSSAASDTTTGASATGAP